MKNEHRQRARAIVLIAAFFGLLTIVNAQGEAGPVLLQVHAASPADPTPEPEAIAKIAPKVRTALAGLKNGEMMTVIVILKEQADVSNIADPDRAIRLQKVIQSRQSTAETTQAALRDWIEARRLEGSVASVTYFWILNGLTITATQDVILELAARPEVLSLTPNEMFQAPAPPSSHSPFSPLSAEPNLTLSNVPAMWGLNFRGQGVVVASMDTGVDINHPDLAARWRGGTNSWFDPYGEHPTVPADVKGHGTWTMGVIVGGDAGGSAVGVAPDAKWIAVKIFNDFGLASVEAIHKSFQWLLDPDGNPNTPDAPHVVNNSWAFQIAGCDLEFQLDLQALRAAGILSVFAAGNTGPGGSTSTSPANYPEAFAVGAMDNSGLIYSGSARGPSACGEAPTIFPELVAPGVNVRTTDLFGGYVQATGTSLAAPHVAGALALLLSAYPDLTATEQEDALINGARDLGPIGPDNAYGYGRLDVLESYRWLSSIGTTSTPTSTKSIGLFEGLNLVSLPLAPDGLLTPAQVLASIDGNYERVYAYSGCDAADPWKVYDPSVPDFVNDLNSVDPRIGLWVQMSASDVLTVTGVTPALTDIPLCAGWNLIGYPGKDRRPVAEVLAPIAGLVERVYAFDAGDTDDPWKLYDPAIPAFASDLTEFKPGFGYWIKIKDAAEATTLSITN